MIHPTQLSTLLKAAIPLLFMIWILWWMGAPARDYHEVLRQFKGQRGLFVNDMLEHEVGGPFDGTPIQELCASKTWTQGLIVSCDPAQGGIGHVRNAHLTCVRLAIEAGAELILPGIVRRSENDISKLNKVANPKGPLRGVHPSYLFDTEHLKSSLQAHCPQMKVYNSIDDLASEPSVLSALKFDPATLPVPKTEGGTLARPDKWLRQFNEWMDRESPKDKRKYPVRVHIPSLCFYWPVFWDGPEFARQFGRILRPHENARRLAAAALYSMNKRYGWHWEPRKEQIKKGSFVGVHLRTEQDAVERFPQYTTQGAEYLNFMAYANLSITFVAHGATATGVDIFSLRARDFGITVVEKRELLEPQDATFLDRMSFDQQGTVDFEILQRAALHTGSSASTFSWNVALRRNTMSEDYGGVAIGDKSEKSDLAVEKREVERRAAGELGDFDAIAKGQAAAKAAGGGGVGAVPGSGDGRIRWVDEFGILYGNDGTQTRAMAEGMWP
ncbi:uncharacterized protein MKZ38_008761 [Zalerion maritima]|uniref:Alternative oxidase n=1 Tax=Zalerion maritima TaxID=339359 RepID=A0AAD5RVN9_9PEZI|nr:uncharacterized protein MKZ38_008761 [Zalerion maritima]